MKLTPQQNKVFEKIKEFINSDASVFILRGYAGTGKTTMIKIIADYISQNKIVALMAPTGRAARILSEKTGIKATTVHRSIYDSPSGKIKEVKDIAETEIKLYFPIAINLNSIVAIVDEASMLCSRKIEHEMLRFGTDNLMEDLLTFVRPSFGGKVIFVGDPAQLPPVGESVSNALRTEYFSERGLKVHEGELTEILRQDESSLILKNAMLIRDLLQQEKRNSLIFEERENDVERVAPNAFLNKYFKLSVSIPANSSIVICYSNKSANKYNKEIREHLYGINTFLRSGDSILITQNNYMLGYMNGEIIPILSVGESIQQSAPVYIQQGGKKVRTTITLSFVNVLVNNADGVGEWCMLLEDFLTSDKPSLSIDESRALYINFCMRYPSLKPGTKGFINALLTDPYYNAIRAKYGYAVTGHKCQGGEWEHVFVDYTDRTGLNDECLRWAYTATTRAKKTLYFTNLPKISPFSKFRIDSIQKCNSIDAECRIIDEVETTPFHAANSEKYLYAKYHCIHDNMQGTPFSIHNIVSRPYLEMYYIQTPNGIVRYDIYYKIGGIFQHAKSHLPNEYNEQILSLLNNERELACSYTYNPSGETHVKLFNLIRCVCDTLSIQITNVVEHSEDFSVIYYFRTSDTFSYIKIYLNAQGFVTYGKPMSLLGIEDKELAILVNEINNHLI